MERRQDVNKYEIMFLVSWLVCGCCIDGIFSDPHALVAVLIALIVAFVSGLGIIKEDMLD